MRTVAARHPNVTRLLNNTERRRRISVVHFIDDLANHGEVQWS